MIISKSVGIIGGLGPDTTASFYKNIISIYQKKFNHEKPNILIASVSIPYSIEQNFILNNQGVEQYIPYLTDAAKRLEKAGADFLVMPCNSLHILIEDIRKSVNIPVISIIDETVQVVQKNHYTTVAIISTLATLKNRLYEQAFEKHTIICINPDKQEQEQISNIINHLVSGTITNNDSVTLQNIIHNFENKNADCIILACTDLQLLQPRHSHIKILDTMHILANAVVTKLTILA